MNVRVWYRFCLLIILAIECYCLDNPYKILSVDKKASLPEIKKAYKQLAKEWHPDKNDHENAEQKFIEIKQAYELLSDPERRKAYDLYGITNEDYQRHRPDYSQYQRFSSDPFDDLFNQHHFFQNQDITFFHKLSITTKYYESNVLPKSKQQPYILFFYSDWCFACIRAASAFKKIIESFENVGVVFATVNAGHEQHLVRKCSIHSLPALVMILDEHAYVYKEHSFTLQKIADFIRQKLPYKLIPSITDEGVEAFLSGWHDNRVRALVFEPRQHPRLRYLLTAFNFKNLVHFGFVQTMKKECRDVIERYKINQNLDTLLLFNEDSVRPLASVSMSDIPLETLQNIIKANQYLALPRLSSQNMLDGICPMEWHRSKKRLCVILITENSPSHDYARHVIRRIAIESSFSERVKFAYIYREKQKEFINALSSSNKGVDDNILKVVVIWRRDARHVKFEWIPEAKLEETTSVENDEENYNQTKRKIDETIQKLLRSSEALAFEAEVLDLFDEHSQSLTSRVLKRIIISIDYLYDSLGKEHIFPAASVLGTILFICGIGYLMSYLVKIEEENVRKKNLYTSKPTADGEVKTEYVPELRIHELRAEKYNGLVRLLKPGCRTIVLIADQQSRPKLLPGFHKAIWPYRRNKTLMFCVMLTERGLGWYSELLRLSLMNTDDTRDLKINPRNCIGTVLGLNGHRKYFCMYHAKHPESSRGNRRMLQMTKTLSYENDDLETGAFLGFESDESASENNDLSAKILLEENLLDGLSNWLDRLFEGSTHRYFINYWPDFPTK